MTVTPTKILARDTAHQAPSQKVAKFFNFSIPSLVSWNMAPDPNNSVPGSVTSNVLPFLRTSVPGLASSNVAPNLNLPESQAIASNTNPGISSSGGMYGGAIPDHSAHWNDYIYKAKNLSPTGKPYGLIGTPDPTFLVDLVANPQNAVTGNTSNSWNTLSDFGSMWLKRTPSNTYKSHNA